MSEVLPVAPLIPFVLAGMTAARVVLHRVWSEHTGGGRCRPAKERRRWSDYL